MSILSGARWSSIALQPIDIECAYPETELIRYFTSLGPLGKALREVQEPKRTEIVKSVRAAFDPFVFGDEVRFKTACWLIKARKE